MELFNVTDTLVVNRHTDEYDVLIMRGTIWGNPFHADEFGRAACIKKYEAYMRERLANEPALRQALKKLAGKRLGCCCKNKNPRKSKQCHGDVLVDLINEEEMRNAQAIDT